MIHQTGKRLIRWYGAEVVGDVGGGVVQGFSYWYSGLVSETGCEHSLRAESCDQEQRVRTLLFYVWWSIVNGCICFVCILKVFGDENWRLDHHRLHYHIVYRALMRLYCDTMVRTSAIKTLCSCWIFKVHVEYSRGVCRVLGWFLKISDLFFRFLLKKVSCYLVCL